MAHRAFLVLIALLFYSPPGFAQEIDSLPTNTSLINKLISPQKIKEGLGFIHFAHSLGYDDKVGSILRNTNFTALTINKSTTVNGNKVALVGSNYYVNDKKVLMDGEYTVYDGYNFTVRDGRTIANGTSILVKGDIVNINGTDVQIQDKQALVNGTNIMGCLNTTALYDTYGHIGSLNCNSVISWGNGTIGKIVTPKTPSGRIRMINPPAPNLVRPYFSIGSNITFEWHLESVRHKPTHLNFVIERTDISHKYVHAYNMSGTTTSYVWTTSDIKQDQTQLIESSSYLLRIYDERGPKEVPMPGYLTPFEAEFSMYISSGLKAPIQIFVGQSANTVPWRILTLCGVFLSLMVFG
ncbi:hypothetical protein K493DRAFT_318047 [Basidiobolus meristosporus CBS 931.73]|uniref:DUF7137 domain-containing protein n=1 Tax=Basidiobolus meristosporus CBS 931.73 TaxID=1314790 RepID=A0A1Y1XX73_9FUNG|nr:hypothetical protein K493DRAFT_318047 [Basidiobolus meristosporus CBS 931.73]|eukprot:ORX90348.1 hypothetical protein K493DRAFT_318047 [Basidiobolus meristosporus CBS 931.73]